MKLNKERGGVYCISNNVNGKMYIGSSTHVNKRLQEHKSALIRQDHHNSHLQKAWNKYGEESFSFTIIEVINGDMVAIRKREQYWLDYYQSYNPSIGYNISHYAVGGGGYEVSAETREKLRQANTGKKHSEETKRKLSEQRTGELNSFYGKTHTEESRRIMSEKTKARDKSSFNIDGLKLGGVKSYTKESYRKLSESHRGERSATSKLTEKNVIDILKMIQAGFTYCEIKKRYNISDSQISRIRHRKRWSYLYEKYPELYK